MDTKPSENNNNNNAENLSPDKGKPAKRRRPLWLRLIKWVVVTALALVVLVLSVVGLAVWCLTSEELTQTGGRVATAYVDAD